MAQSGARRRARAVAQASRQVIASQQGTASRRAPAPASPSTPHEVNQDTISCFFEALGIPECAVRTAHQFDIGTPLGQIGNGFVPLVVLRNTIRS